MIEGTDVLTEERTIPQEKLDRMINHIMNDLMLIDACLAIEDCVVDSVELNERRVILLEKLEEITNYSLDPINNEKPQFKPGKRMKENNNIEKLSFGVHISNKIIKLNNELMMIDACLVIEDCNIDDDVLEEKQFKINMDLEKLNYCSENIEECESHKKDSKHKKHRR